MTATDASPATVTIFGGATIDRIAASKAKPGMGVSNPGATRTAVGGVAFNVASILARLGLTARLVTRVGDDPDGGAIRAAGRSAGIDMSAVTTSPDTATATYVATLDDQGGLVIGISAMAICDALTPTVVAPAAADAGGLWVVDANLPRETIAFLVERATQAGRPLAAMTVSPAKAVRLIPVLGRVTYLFANRYEAAALLERDPAANADAGDLAGELARRSAAHVAVTDGAGPVAIAEGTASRAFTPPAVTVANVNGAGDSLAAGTIFAVATGRRFIDAIPFGLAAAAMTLEAGGVLRASFAPGCLDRNMATTAE